MLNIPRLKNYYADKVYTYKNKVTKYIGRLKN